MSGNETLTGPETVIAAIHKPERIHNGMLMAENREDSALACAAPSKGDFA